MFAVGQRVLCKATFPPGKAGTITRQSPPTDPDGPQCYLVDLGGGSKVFCREEDLEALPEAKGEGGANE